MKKNVILLLLFLLHFSCGKDEADLSQVKNLNGNKITAFGHAGMGIASQFPINTFESLSNALNLGADGVEVDIQFTKDSVLVLYHNRLLEEQTNLEGMISEHNWSYVQQAIYKNPIYSEYKIISLDQFFANLDDPKKHYYSFDLKLYQDDHSDTYINSLSRSLIQFIDHYDLSENVFIESQRINYLEKLQNLRPDLNLFYWENSPAGIQKSIDFGFYGFIIDTAFISKEEIQEAHAAGIRISLFGIKSKADNLDAIEKSPDFLQTDKIKHLVDILK